MLTGGPGDSALRRNAGLAHGMTSAVAAAFAAAQGMVDRVHRLGSGVGTNAHMAGSSGFADADVDPIQISKLADGGTAGAANSSHFAGRQNDDGPFAFAGSEPADAAGGTDHLAALAGV